MTAAAIPDRADAAYHLDCLEVWGGSTRIDTAVRVTGLDAWICSEPLTRDVAEPPGDAAVAPVSNRWMHGLETDATVVASQGEPLTRHGRCAAISDVRRVPCPGEPAQAVRGGDVYLASMCACAAVSRFLVADVTGHGADAAEYANRLRRLMRRYINKPDQTRLARSLNRDFAGLEANGRFATAMLVTFFPPTRHLILCNAGHPRPLRYQAATGQWTVLDAASTPAGDDLRNLPLGVMPQTGYVQFAVPLQPYDLVLIYTDGLSEATGPDGAMLGKEGLLRILRGIDPDRPDMLLPALRQAVGAFRNHASAEDDITVLLLRSNGQQPPRQSLLEKTRVMARLLGLLPSKSQGKEV